MAAGLGFKDFVTGEVLTAADVDGYLMQGIWVFASAAARDAAVTSPQEGNACYLKDTNQVLTYSGSAWVAVGGGSPLTTKGDLYGFSTVDARIPIGTNNQVLTADSAQALGLKWATPSAGALALVKRSSFSDVAGTGTTFDNVFTSTYKAYMVVIEELYAATSSDDGILDILYSGTAHNEYYGASGGAVYNSATFNNIQNNGSAQFTFVNNLGASNQVTSANFMFTGVGGSSNDAVMIGTAYDSNATARVCGFGVAANAYTGFRLRSSSTNVSGTVAVYGLAAA